MEKNENNIISKIPLKEEQSQESEKISCQYCQDVGTCSYCDRGRLEANTSGNKQLDKK